jgi:ABC-type transporter Mla MlaB component
MESESIGSSVDLLVCQREHTPQGVLFHLRGELVLASIPILWSNLKAAFEDGNHVIVDLAEVHQIDQSGITALEELHRLFLGAGQRFVVVAAPDSAQRWSQPQGLGPEMKACTSTGTARHSLVSEILQT